MQSCSPEMGEVCRISWLETLCGASGRYEGKPHGQRYMIWGPYIWEWAYSDHSQCSNLSPWGLRPLPSTDFKIKAVTPRINRDKRMSGVRECSLTRPLGCCRGANRGSATFWGPCVLGKDFFYLPSAFTFTPHRAQTSLLHRPLTKTWTPKVPWGWKRGWGGVRALPD
jgi:hypothetical protein